MSFVVYERTIVNKIYIYNGGFLWNCCKLGKKFHGGSLRTNVRFMLLSIYSSFSSGKNWNLNFKKWQYTNSQKEKEEKNKKEKEEKKEGEARRRRRSRRKKQKEKEEVKEEEEELPS